MKPKRAKGVIVIDAVEPTGALAEEAKAVVERRREETQARAERRANAPVPNHIAYRNIVFFVGKNIDANGQWLGGRLPRCKVCDANLPPGESHVCSGFQPKYSTVDPAERHAKWEARREMIRESRALDAGVFCSVCGEHMEDPEDGQRHWEDHEGRPERNHYAIDGEPDGDLDGYDDEPEDDYCEGDDDGWDCD